MRISRVIVLMAAVSSFFVSTTWAQGQQAQDQQTKAYIDMMRKDIRAEKQAIVDRGMELEAGDKAKFWTVYNKYQGEVKTLWDQRLANINKYADNFENMTDKVADEIALKAMDIDSQRGLIRKKYYEQMKTALGARSAARFLQVEALLDHLIELQILAEIPLIK